MTTVQTHPEAREIAATVVVPAPRAAVWQASLDPTKIRQWWGCGHVEMTVCEADVRAGGAYRFVGVDPGGSEHAFHGEYREVDENARVVHTQVYEPFPDCTAVVTVTLEDRDGATELTSRIVFPDDASYEGAAESGMVEGMRETLDRMAEVAASRELSITRLIDAPRDRLFAAWTQPEPMKRWFAPRPWTVPEAEIDLRVGGGSRVVMRSPEGAEFPVEGVYLEIVKDAKIVFTDAFRAGWQTTPNPFFVGIVTLEDEDGKTRYTATVRHWSVEDRMRHEAMGFEPGWNQCLDQLIELVNEAPVAV